MEKPNDIKESNEYDLYLAYLNSKTWTKKRNKALKRDNFKCSICNNPNNLQVHHLIYPQVLGTEPICDLMTLCERCHKDLEAYKKGYEYNNKTGHWRFKKNVWIRLKSISVFDFQDIKTIIDQDNGYINIMIYVKKENLVRNTAMFCTFNDVTKLRDKFGIENVVIE